MASAWALIAWYICAWTANWVAASADTSSAAGGSTPAVGVAAAAFWALNMAPTPARLAAVAASASGCVVTNDIGNPFDGLDVRMQARECRAPASELGEMPRNTGICSH